jgi:hypothetical protein
MPASNFNLRNVAPNVMSLLKKEVIKQKISINSLILHILEQGLGIAHSTKKTVFHDLDDLAGTWNDKDKKEFGNLIICEYLSFFLIPSIKALIFRKLFLQDKSNGSGGHNKCSVAYFEFFNIFRHFHIS